MINYNPELLETFKNTDRTEIYGTDIVLKSIPEGIPSGLDPREKALFFKAAQNYKPAVTLQDHRDATGFPALNLNTKAVLTDKLTLESNGHSFDLWEYRLRRSNTAGHSAALLYIHGGSFFAGSAQFMENLCKYICEEADCVVYNIEYSLAPEMPFPLGLNDCFETLDYVYNNAEKLGIDRNKICISGDSAGAGIAAAVALNDEKRRISYMGLLYPCVLMDVADEAVPWREEDFDIPKEEREIIVPRLRLGRSDGKGNEEFMMSIGFMYLGENRELCSDPRVSPLRAEIKSAPKTTVITAEYDGLRPQGEVFARKLREAGANVRCIRYRGVFHAFAEKLGYLPQAQDALLEIAQDIRSL